jgi:hypothetical protein
MPLNAPEKPDLQRRRARRPKEQATEGSLFFGAVVPMYQRALPEVTYLARRYGRRLRRPMPGRPESWYEVCGTRAPLTKKKIEAIEEGKNDLTRVIDGIFADNPRVISGHDVGLKIAEDTGGKAPDGRVIGRLVKAKGYKVVASEQRVYQKKIPDDDGRLSLVPNSTFFVRPDLEDQVAGSVAIIRGQGLLDVFSKKWISMKEIWENREAREKAGSPAR